MVVAERIVHRHVVPVGGHGHRFAEVAVFTQHYVGIEHLAQFFCVVLPFTVMCIVALSNQYGGAVVALEPHEDAFIECALVSIVAIDKLTEFQYILFVKLVGIQSLHLTDARHVAQLFHETSRVVLCCSGEPQQQHRDGNDDSFHNY